ncbi:MAG: DUF2797 domain-containing protein [Bacteroidetes bacterium]|nr:MAG: DUF2797 domain-containing protein [Bacteroidota bacterium]
MDTQYGDPVQYQLRLGEETVDMNALIGKEIHLHYEGEINCRVCGRKTNKAFGEGFCYQHFMESPENSPCILRPELCEGHLGKGRDLAWELANHVQPHIVYLALSGGIKVGITRLTQVPTRWIDQGAWKAIQLAETPNRFLAGSIEVALKEYVGDKTSWQAMLKDSRSPEDLETEKYRLADNLPSDLSMYVTENDAITEIRYPVETYPDKVKSVGFDKEADVRGVLTGIRGQYLIFGDNRVLNLRSHTGYKVRLEA